MCEIATHQFALHEPGVAASDDCSLERESSGGQEYRSYCPGYDDGPERFEDTACRRGYATAPTTQDISGSGSYDWVIVIDRRRRGARVFDYPRRTARLGSPVLWSDPAESGWLLHAPGFQHLLDQLGKTYDRIIFDAPPINPVSDPMVLATMVDGLVMVVASHQTRTPALSMAVKRLGEVQAKILGLVLNKVSLTVGSGFGYGQYSYNYQYYTSPYNDNDDTPSEAA